MDPGSVESRLLIEGAVVTALVTVGLVVVMAVGYMSDILGAAGRRAAVAILMILLAAAIVATTAFLFPQEAKHVYDYLDQLSYR